MDDEARIHVEPGAPEGSAWPGTGASSRRVVHEPTRRGRVAAVVVLAALVAGGLALSLGGSGADDPRPDEPPPPPESPADAYRAAVARLGQARTFAYRGEVHAAERTALRPGTWLDGEVSVEGAVLLPRSITRELAFTPGGGPAVETVTSGSTAWSRTASSPSGLSGVEWERVAWNEQVGSPPSAPNPESLGSGRLGIALVVDLLRATEDRRPGPDDADGNRVLRATIPADREHRERFGDMAGAEVTLAVDEAGDIVDVRLATGPADDPELVVELALEQLGDPGLITPADVGSPVRDGVDIADLAAAGVHPLELSRLPAGWALTSGGQASAGSVVMCGTAPGSGGCGESGASCTMFGLTYQDLAAVSDGELWLSVRSDGCFEGSGADALDPAEWGGEPFRAGRFTGWVAEFPTGTNGAVSDGETTVQFQTDLSADDAGDLLATLVPFDATTEPEVLPGVPSL